MHRTMKFTPKGILLDREVNELDRFVLKFIAITEGYTDYVIVSGYVALLLGRNRATEDIDMIIPKMAKELFHVWYTELCKNGFWCINTGAEDEMYDILLSKHSVRFAIADTFSPNMEIKFAKDDLDREALLRKIRIQIDGHVLNASALEFQIAYKEEILMSDKDMEDAEHIRKVAGKYLNSAVIDEYKKMLRS